MKDIKKEIERLEKQRKEFYKVYHTALDKSFVAKQIDALTKAIDVLKTKIQDTKQIMMSYINWVGSLIFCALFLTQ